MLTRRGLLKIVTSAPFVAMPQLGNGQSAARSLIVLLDLRNASLQKERITAIIDAFQTQGIALSLVLPALSKEASMDVIDIYSTAANLVAKGGGAMDLVVGFQDPLLARRYQTLRAATDLRRRLAGISASLRAGSLSVWPVDGQPVAQVQALRAAGLRTQIILPVDTDTSTTFDSPDWGQLRISGGFRAKLGDDPAVVTDRLASVTGNTVLMLLPDVADTGDDGAAWANALARGFWEGAFLTTRPSDYLLQFNPGASKLVSVLLDMRDGGGGLPGLQALVDGLDGEGLPYGRLVFAKDRDAHDAVVMDSEHREHPIQCLLTPPPAGSDSLARFVLSVGPSGDGVSGPDADARITLAVSQDPVSGFRDSLDAEPLTDAVFLITEADAATPLRRESILSQLRIARRDGLAHFRGVTHFVETLFAPDAVYRRYWAARERAAEGPPAARPLTENERTALREDAALAWRLIVDTTHSVTGMAAGTRQEGSPGSTDRQITFWDLGSQLQGTCAALDIGLISSDEAQERCAKLLRFLPTTEIDGLNLPPALFHGGTLAVIQQGYDICDMGRFLLALDHVVQRGLLTRAEGAAIVARWNLAATLRDGVAFGYSNGRLQDMSATHCTTYARQGFAAWGLDFDLVLPELGADANADDHINLVYGADDIGHFGAEPYLLEAIETQSSRASTYLAEILFDAQVRWFQQTGSYKCVSEAPLNFAPWFSFQGLRPSREGEGAWVISTLGNDPAHQGRDFDQRAALISSKAAYLWGVLSDHPYAAELLQLTRTKARASQGGFTVGLMESDLSPMWGYSDLNTNGIILQAIAYRLSKS